MRKTLALMFAFMTAIAAAPTGGGEAAAEPVDWTLLVTADGAELVFGPQPVGQEECAGEAPGETYCTTMLHVADEVWAVALGASFTYSGTLEVRLFHATSVLVTQVHVMDGWPVGFETYGAFPGSPAVFWHECFSYDLATNGNNPLPLPLEENGTPGGSGAWDCFVLYP